MISSPLRQELRAFFERAYSEGYDRHGALALEEDHLTDHILRVIEKRLGAGSNCPDRLQSFLSSLYTPDLYLAVACGYGSDAAWARLNECYGAFVRSVALQFAPAGYAAADLAEAVCAELFLPDTSGRSRILSYDGQYSLATWLRVVVSRRALNERRRRWNSVERIDDVEDISVDASVAKIEAMVRANRYAGAITIACKLAVESLNNREQTILLLLYREALTPSEAARSLGVYPSTISYHTRRIHEKLKRQILCVLERKYHFCDAPIEECLAELMENPAYSLLELLSNRHLQSPTEAHAYGKRA
jgi:RNA polymerase sigma factor (sigma-70 family)